MKLKLRARHRVRINNNPMLRSQDRRDLEQKDLDTFLKECVQISKGAKDEQERGHRSANIPNKKPLTEWEERRRKQKLRRWRRFEAKRKAKEKQEKQQAQEAQPLRLSA